MTAGYATQDIWQVGSPNPDKARVKAAAEETGRFIENEMGPVTYYPTRNSLLKHSVESVDPNNDGLFCEFGVFQGDTINYIAGLTSRKVHGFDSFEGLPEDWRAGFNKGAFKTALPEVKPNVVLYKGWFDNSIGPFMEKEKQQLAFLHLDADLYSSTKTVLEMMADRIVPGTILHYDEYFNYPGWKFGEHKAHREFVQKYNVEVQYLGFSTEQVAMRVTAIRGQQWTPPSAAPAAPPPPTK